MGIKKKKVAKKKKPIVVTEEVVVEEQKEITNEAVAEETEQVVEGVELKVGDTVEIVASGKATENGANPTTGGIGWTRKILDIKEGKEYPYKVGSDSGITGFYQESALKKK